MLVNCKPRKVMEKLLPVWLVQSSPSGWWFQDLNFFSFPALTVKDRPQASRWGALTMMESMVPFFSAALECQQGQMLSAGHSQEHIANADRAVTANAESLCWRCASPSWVPQAVLTSGNTHLRANMGKSSKGRVLQFISLQWALLLSCSGPVDGNLHVATSVSESHLVSCFFVSFYSVTILSWYGLAEWTSSRIWDVGLVYIFGYFGRGTGGFLPFAVKKKVKRLTVFWAFGFVGVLCVFPAILCYSHSLWSIVLLITALCTYVPSHLLEQVGGSMTDLKMEHCHGARRSPASQGGAVLADVSQKC